MTNEQSQEEIKQILDTMASDCVSKKILLPMKFQPQFANQFIVDFLPKEQQPFESFLIKSVRMHGLIKKSFWSKKLLIDNINYFPDITIVANLACAPSMTQSAVECLWDNKKIDISIKKIDPRGTAVEHRIYRKCKLKSFDFGDLSYEDKTKVDTITMHFKCKYFELEY